MGLLPNYVPPAVLFLQQSRRGDENHIDSQRRYFESSQRLTRASELHVEKLASIEKKQKPEYRKPKAKSCILTTTPQQFSRPLEAVLSRHLRDGQSFYGKMRSYVKWRKLWLEKRLNRYSFFF